VTPAKIRKESLPKAMTFHYIVLVRAEPRPQPIILGRLDKASRTTKLQLSSPVTSDILLSCSIFLRAKITSLSIAPLTPFGLYTAFRSLARSLSLSLPSSHVSFTSSLRSLSAFGHAYFSLLMHISAISSERFGLSSDLSITP
jgi:hypothetical protein